MSLCLIMSLKATDTKFYMTILILGSPWRKINLKLTKIIKKLSPLLKLHKPVNIVFHEAILTQSSGFTNIGAGIL